MAAGTLSPVFKQYFPDANGRPMDGARIYSFAAGTSSPIPIFADALLTTPLSNPAIADGSGRLTFWLSPTSYKFAVHDKNDVLQYEVGPVGAVPPNEVDLDVQQIAGESLGDRAVAYLANGTGGTTPGQWYLTDADSVDTSTGVNIIGIAPQAISAGTSGAIRLQGRIDGFSGLTPGASYFISAVPGEITAVAPPNARFIGIANDTTSLIMTVSGVAQAQPPDPNFNTVTISDTGASALQVAGGIVAGRVQVTALPGGAAAGTIGLVGNQLSFLGGSSGHAFFNSGGGLQASVDAAGNWSMNGALAVDGVTTLNNAENVFSAFRVTGIGGAAAGKIGFTANQLAFLGGSSGHAFFNSGGGLTTSVDAVGNWSMNGRINSATAQPGFLAYRASDVAIPAGTTTIVFNTEVYDEAGNYDPVTGVFTALVPGRYLFCVTVGATTSVAAADTVLVTSNGSYHIARYISTDLRSHSASVTADMDAGDTARVNIITTASGVVVGVNTGWRYTFFSGRLMP